MMTEQAMSEALADCMAEKLKYRERAWHAESQLEVRYGLRQAINTALGLTDETGDDALRKGLATIDAMKRELAAMTKRADEMERLKEHNAQLFYRIERELADLKAQHAWRPIETAPKDWEHVLLFDGTLDPFDQVHEGFYSAPDGGLDKWISCVVCSEFNPTHWQPLPEPPKEGAE